MFFVRIVLAIGHCRTARLRIGRRKNSAACTLHVFLRRANSAAYRRCVSSVGDEGFERLGDVGANDEIGHVVEIGRLAVENHKARSAPLGEQWKTRCRPNDQRRADGEKEIAGAGKRFGAPHGRFWHRLAKRDCCGFDVAAAIVTVRCAAVGFETHLDPGKLITPAAIKACGIGGIAMQLHDLVGRKPRGLVQIVDVLRDDCGIFQNGAGLPAPDGRSRAVLWKNCFSMAKRRRQDSLRISALSMNSSNAMG